MKLEEIRVLCEAATPGPWAGRQTEQSKEELLEGIGAMLDKGGSVFRYVICDLNHPDDNERMTVAHVGNGANGVANTKLIAAARTLMPLLLEVAEAAADVASVEGYDMLYPIRNALAALEAADV